MPQEVKLSDPSGRGRVDGYKVIFPQMQHPYTEEEIEAVVHVMRNAEGQTQGKYLEKFEQDFAAFVGAKHAFGVNNCTNALKLAASDLDAGADAVALGAGLDREARNSGD